MKGTSLKYLTHEGFRNVWVNRLMSLASVTVLMACLIIMGAGIMIYFNINNVVDKVQSQNVVMVYVADDASEDETTQIGTSLEGISNVESCEFVPKEVAFQEQIQSMGGDAALFEGFDEIPLPDAYKVTVKDLSQFENTVSQIKQINKVDSVREPCKQAFVSSPCGFDSQRGACCNAVPCCAFHNFKHNTHNDVLEKA